MHGRKLFVNKPEISSEAKCRPSHGQLITQPVANRIMKLTISLEWEQDLPRPGRVHACISLSLFIVVL